MEARHGPSLGYSFDCSLIQCQGVLTVCDTEECAGRSVRGSYRLKGPYTYIQYIHRGKIEVVFGGFSASTVCGKDLHRAETWTGGCASTCIGRWVTENALRVERRPDIVRGRGRNA